MVVIATAAAAAFAVVVAAAAGVRGGGGGGHNSKTNYFLFWHLIGSQEIDSPWLQPVDRWGTNYMLSKTKTSLLSHDAHSNLPATNM